MIVLFVCKDTNKNSINKNYLDKSVVIIHFYQDKSVDMVHFYQDNVIAFVHHLAACRAASDGCVPCPQGDALGYICPSPLGWGVVHVTKVPATTAGTYYGVRAAPPPATKVNNLTY